MSDFKPGLDGVIATDTNVSYLDVDNEEIVIRGYDLIELADSKTYPEVAYLVIHGKLPNVDQLNDFQKLLLDDSAFPSETYDLLKLIPKTSMVMDVIRTGISYLAGFNKESDLMNTTEKNNLDKGTRLIAEVAVLTANSYRILNDQEIIKPDSSKSFSQNFLEMILGKSVSSKETEIFDKILTCYIEHEMPNSTFAARVIGSTLSDIYGAFVGGISSLKGPLHGGANEAAIHMILDIKSKGGANIAEEYILEKLKNKERIMGFGHRVYMKKYDPRALFLRDYISDLESNIDGGEELHRIYKIVEEAMAREKGLYPNTDYPIALLFYLLGIPVPLYTPIFFASRTAGLVAHVIEQHNNNRLFRPRVLYTGPRGLKI
ncbi:MAG: citrate/2-methylcitrate synthase [Dehalococcoidia bacterium]